MNSNKKATIKKGLESKELHDRIVGHDSDRRTFAEFLRERIYGSITLMAVSCGLLLDIEHLSVNRAYGAIIVTAFGLWAASLFAEYISYRVVHDKLMPRRDLIHMFIVHRGILVSAIPSLMMITIAALDITSLRTALITDIILAGATMSILILRSAKTSTSSLATTLIASSVQVAIAAAIIGLKLLDH